MDLDEVRWIPRTMEMISAFCKTYRRCTAENENTLSGCKYRLKRRNSLYWKNYTAKTINQGVEGGKNMLNNTELLYFSPTGGTKKAGKIFCEGISQNVKMVDLGIRDKTAEQSDSELTVISVPVFGGRIPAVIAKKLRELDGNGKKAVTLAVYGNRAYEDALLELNDVVKDGGFRIIASAAVIAQHSIVPEVGQGRPDKQDRESILMFAGKVLNKIESGSETPVKVPGNNPYKNEMNIPGTPISLPSCNQCGTCVSVLQGQFNRKITPL